MKRIIINELEQIASEDLNNLQKTVHESLYDKVLRKFFQDEDGVLGSSFLVARTSATTVSVAAGRAFLWDAAQVSPEPKYRAIEMAVDLTLTIGAGTWTAAPTAPNNRIDIICIRTDENVITTATRKVKTGGVIADETVDKTIEQQYEINVVEGTAGLSPTAPATPAGWLKIAEVIVTGGSNIASANDVIDSRTILQPVFDSINADTRVVSPSGNGTDSTLAAAISNLPAGGGSILITEDLTINSVVTVGDATVIKGRSKATSLTFTAGGKLVISGDDSKLQDLNLITAQAALPTLVEVNGDRFTARDCLVTLPAAGTNTAFDLNGDEPDLVDIDYTNTIESGGTNTRFTTPPTVPYSGRARSIQPIINAVVVDPGEYSSNKGLLIVPQFPFLTPTVVLSGIAMGGVPSGGLGFSPGGEFLAVGTTTTPFLTITQRRGINFTPLANPGTLPAAGVLDLDWTLDSQFLATVHGTSPFVTVYQREGSVFTKLTNPATLPTGVGQACAWSPNGEMLAVGHTSSPFLSMYRRTGSTLTKISDPASLPTGQVSGVDWSWDGRFLACGVENSPFLAIYERSGLSTYTKLANPGTLPPAGGNNVSFSPDGKYLAVGHSLTPFITIYSISGNTFTKIANPSSLPGGQVDSLKWSLDSRYLYCTTSISSPFHKIYEVLSDGTFTALPSLGTSPTGTYSVAPSFDNQFLAFGTSTDLVVYQTAKNLPENSSIWNIKGVKRAT